jgi:predicted site-specific integrase-resolvase
MGGSFMENYLMAKEIKAKYKIHVDTLYRWEKQGLLHPLRTGGGHRRYSEAELLTVMGAGRQETGDGSRCAIYGRVSTRKQADSGNLRRQMERLKEVAKRRKYVVLGEYRDVASGLNEHRRELGVLLKGVAQNRFDVVLVEYRDRLARFGFGYLKEFCSSFNVRIEEVDDRPAQEPQEELVEDMISIMTSFSARLYGKRGGRVVKKLCDILESEEVNIGDNNGNGSNP